MSLQDRPPTKLLCRIIIALYSSPTESHRWIATIWQACPLRRSHHTSSGHLGGWDLLGGIGSLDQLLTCHFCPFPGKDLVNKAVRLTLIHGNSVKLLAQNLFFTLYISLFWHKYLIKDVLGSGTMLFRNAFIVVLFHYHLFIPFLFLIFVPNDFKELKNGREFTLFNFVV
jgi:hypothetical protein